MNTDTEGPRSQGDRYIPALAYRWLTPLYDPVVQWTTRERAFKAALLKQAEILERARKNVSETRRFATPLGTIALYAAHKPA